MMAKSLLFSWTPNFGTSQKSMRLQIPLSGGRAQPNTKSNTGIQATPATLRAGILQNKLGYNNLLYIATVLGDLLEKRASEKLSYTSLLIEEPEAHLHPHWQNTLFRSWDDQVAREFQVFVDIAAPRQLRPRVTWTLWLFLTVAAMKTFTLYRCDELQFPMPTT